MITSFLTELLVFLARHFEEHSSGRESLMVSRLGGVISKIESEYGSDIRLDDLVQIAHMSKRSFMRHFTRIFSATPIHYLLNTRIEKAKEMLISTDKTILQVAFDVGFTDSNYFSRAFKQKVGLPPRAFRKKTGA